MCCLAFFVSQKSMPHRKEKEETRRMKKIDFNKNWTCRCITREEPEKKVALPHDAMRSEPRRQRKAGEREISAGTSVEIMNT